MPTAASHRRARATLRRRVATDSPGFPVRAAAPRRVRRARVAAGFTLLELLAVIAVIAVLAGIAIGVGRRAVETGQVARAKAELAALSAALEGYRRQHGDYPRTTDNATLVQALIGRVGPTGTALDPAGRAQIEVAKFTLALPAAPSTPVDPFTNPAAQLLDPWGQPYRYAYAARGGSWQAPSFLLVSAGPDEKLTLPLPATGFITPAFEAMLDADQQPVNADNLVANRP